MEGLDYTHKGKDNKGVGVMFGGGEGVLGVGTHTIYTQTNTHYTQGTDT